MTQNEIVSQLMEIYKIVKVLKFPLISRKSTCAICLSIIDNKVFLPCNHYFCEACIDCALKYQQQCPICRRIYVKPIGGDFRRKKFQVVYDQRWWELENHQLLPLIEQSTRNLQFKMLLSSFRDVFSVNIALKTNLLIAIQTQYSKILGMCDICMIKKINVIDQTRYFIILESIDRAKVQKIVGIQLENKEILYQTLPIKMEDEFLNPNQILLLKEMFKEIQNYLITLARTQQMFQPLLDELLHLFKREIYLDKYKLSKFTVKFLLVFQTEDMDFTILYFQNNIQIRTRFLLSKLEHFIRLQPLLNQIT